MPLLRILLLLGLLWVCWRMLRRALFRNRTRERPAASGDWMVPCRHCGVHVPRNDAVTDAAGHHYCSEAHRRAGEPGRTS